MLLYHVLGKILNVTIFEIFYRSSPDNMHG